MKECFRLYSWNFGRRISFSLSVSISTVLLVLTIRFMNNCVPCSVDGVSYPVGAGIGVAGVTREVFLPVLSAPVRLVDFTEVMWVFKSEPHTAADAATP